MVHQKIINHSYIRPWIALPPLTCSAEFLASYKHRSTWKWCQDTNFTAQARNKKTVEAATAFCFSRMINCSIAVFHVCTTNQVTNTYINKFQNLQINQLKVQFWGKHYLFSKVPMSVAMEMFEKLLKHKRSCDQY